jgi:nucleotidyltransferase substrate binding protein (TIGR01987 family)
MPLDLTSLNNAVQRLREGLARHQREPADEQLRDGLIQRFEYTYELSHKMLRRFLREAAASPEEIDRLEFADLIRAGDARGLLLANWPIWRRFREMRARSPRSYDTDSAAVVIAEIPAFLEEAQHLRAALDRRLSSIVAAEQAPITRTCQPISRNFLTLSHGRLK